MQKITPFLWFESRAEEAAAFYTSLFPDSKITTVTRYGEAGPGPKGSVMSVIFQLAGQDFYALNGGAQPQFQFSPAISFFVNCKAQAEIDFLWEKLSEGGEPLQCGWVRDRYGVTWQIVPTLLSNLLHHTDAARSQNVMRAMFQMTKLDVAKLQAAFDEG